MRKRWWMAAVMVIGCFLVAQAAYAQYDSAAAKATMKQVAGNLQELQKKAAAKDYFGTAEKFMDIAKTFKALDKVTPPKGAKAEWDRIHGNMIKAAFKGIGACGAGNDAGIKAAVDELVRYRNEGHKIFK